MSQQFFTPPPEVDIDHLVTEDDAPVDNLFSEISEKQQRLLVESLYASWPGPADTAGGPRRFLAAANVGLFPSVHQPPLVPDMFLSLDVQVAEDWYARRHRSYFFWEFGKAPEVVVEIVSNREGGERGKKLYDYARMGVAYYVIHDPARTLSDIVLEVYELRAGRYQTRDDMALPEAGLGVTLWDGEYEGKRAEWLRWRDAGGRLIETGAERAQREAERAHRLAARLRELGIDPDQV